MEDVKEKNESENQVKTFNDETKNQQTEMNHNDSDVIKDKENSNPNKEESETNNIQQARRHDEPSELSFEICE